METKYINLIRSNKLDELANITNPTDLTRYRYLNKYLIEYLLEKGIHSRRMDSQAKHNVEWINYYLKYNIIEPLLYVKGNTLFLRDGNELIIEKLLRVLSNEEKLQLLTNMKTEDYWEYRMNESIIIKLYEQHGIKIPRIFIPLPSILDEVKTKSKRVMNDLEKFKNAFSDTNPIILEAFSNEFIRSAKKNYRMTHNDIIRLSTHKRVHSNYQILLSDYEDNPDINPGEYTNERIVICLEDSAILCHELSHLSYHNFESLSKKEYNEFKKYHWQAKKLETIKKIVIYLDSFHKRFDEMRKIFDELYFATINKTYGNYNNYANKIATDIKNLNPTNVTVGKFLCMFAYEEDSIKEIINELIYSDMLEYRKRLTFSYFRPEIALEAFLSDLLLGELLTGKYQKSVRYGHDKDDLASYLDSFNECLAEFYELKYARNSKILIDRLRDIVGDEVVDFFDNYIEKKRNVNVGKKILSKKRGKC